MGRRFLKIGDKEHPVCAESDRRVDVREIGGGRPRCRDVSLPGLPTGRPLGGTELTDEHRRIEVPSTRDCPSIARNPSGLCLDDAETLGEQWGKRSMTPSWSGLVLLAYQAAEQAAEAAKPAEGAPQDGGAIWNNIMFPILIIMILFVVMNPFGRKEEKKRQEMLNSLKKNDRILTAGGIYGRIAYVKPDVDEIVIKIDDDKDVKITVTKSSILRKLSTEDEKEAKPAT